MSQSALQQAPEAASASLSPVPRAGESLVALTHDETLIETLSSVAPEHVLFVVGHETELSARLATEPTGVALLDAEAVQTPLTELTQRLRAQFPDLVLVVAGGPGDQGTVASQVTRGIVYRFLHKPVSAQRVKLFVDAAWRRHDVEHAATGNFAALKLEDPTAEPTLPQGVLWGAGALVAVGAALALWFLLHSSGAPVAVATGTGHLSVSVASAGRAAPPSTVQSASQTPAQTQAPTEIQALLARADEALARGALTVPAGDSAAELYAQVLTRDGANARARAGMAQVLDQLLTGAEQALLAGQLERATKLTEAAHTLQPANVRVAFLVAQLAKERERARPSGVPTAPVAGSGHATGDGSVREHAAQLLTQARLAMQNGQLSDAERLLIAAGDAGSPAEELALAQRQLQNQRVAAKASLMARYSEQFHQRLTQGKLLEPQGDSARFYLEQLQAADPSHPSTVLARDALVARLLDESRTAMAREDLNSAQDLLGAARAVDPSAADAASVERAIGAARDKANTPPPVVTESLLQRVRTVQPVYPTVAERLGRSGVVDMEYTVRSDGTVTDLTIIDSKPAGMFDASAKDAVRQWHYQPTRRDGQPVDQRVRLHMVFTP